MKFFLYLCLIFAVTNSSAQNRIKGRIDGLSKAGIHTLYLYDFGSGKGTITKDSAIVNGDAFEFNLGLVEPKIYSLGVESKKMLFTLWLDNSNLNITGKMEDMYIIEEKRRIQRLYTGILSEGSPNQKLHNDFFKSITPDLMEQYGKTGGLSIMAVGEMDKNKSSILNKTKSFIFLNKNLPISAFVLFYLSANEEIIDKPEASALYAKLTKDVQESFYGLLFLNW